MYIYKSFKRCKVTKWFAYCIYSTKLLCSCIENMHGCLIIYTYTGSWNFLSPIFFKFVNVEGFIPDGDEANNRAYLTYYLTPAGGKKLRRLLCVLKHLNPDITHCPLLEPIVSILLHFMDEEDVFKCASGILHGEFTSPFLDQTKLENITTDASLQDLFKSYHVSLFVRVFLLHF